MYFCKINFLRLSIFLLVLLVTLQLFALEVALSQLDPQLRGEITRPKDQERVSRRFSLEGNVSGSYRNLWLVEKIGELYWPKEPRLTPTPNGTWTGMVFEGGYPPDNQFEILLMDVSNETNKKFKEWLQQGHRSGHYPGLTTGELGDKIILNKKTYNLIMN